MKFGILGGVWQCVRTLCFIGGIPTDDSSSGTSHTNLTAVESGLSYLHLNFPFTSISIGVGQELEPFRPEDVEFRVFTRQNQNNPETIRANRNGQFVEKSERLDNRRLTKLLTHGFTANMDQRVFTDMKDVYLDRKEYNTILVDWSESAKGINYITAMGRTKQVADLVVRFLTHYDLNKVHIVGHSLGAHIGGFVARRIKDRVRRVTGLDPAGPGFDNSQNNPSKRLDSSDAEFVDAIYTNVGNLANLHFGIDFSIADANFYVNGGKNQPGCTFLIPLIGLFPSPKLNQRIDSLTRTLAKRAEISLMKNRS